MNDGKTGILRNHPRVATWLAKTAAGGKSFGNAFFVVNFLTLIVLGQLGKLDMVTQSMIGQAFIAHWYWMVPIIVLGIMFLVGLVTISWGMEAKTLRHMLVHGADTKPEHQQPSHQVAQKEKILSILKVFFSSLGKAVTVGYGTFLTLEIFLGTSNLAVLLGFAITAAAVVFIQACCKEGWHHIVENSNVSPPRRSKIRQWLLGYPLATTAAVAKALGYGWGMMCLVGIISTGHLPSMAAMSTHPLFHVGLFLLMASIATSVLGMEGRGAINRIAGRIKDDEQRYIDKVWHQHVRVLLMGVFWSAGLAGAMAYMPGLGAALRLDLAVVVGCVVLLAAVGRFLYQLQADKRADSAEALYRDRNAKLLHKAAWLSRGVSLVTSVSKGAAFAIGAFKICSFIYLPGPLAITVAAIIGILVAMIPMAKERLALERQVVGLAPKYSGRPDNKLTKKACRVAPCVRIVVASIGRHDGGKGELKNETNIDRKQTSDYSEGARAW